MIADLSDDQVAVKVKGAERAGNELFGMNAEVFLKLSLKEAYLKLGNFMHMPHTGTVIIDKNSMGDITLTLFDIKQVSPSVIWAGA